MFCVNERMVISKIRRPSQLLQNNKHNSVFLLISTWFNAQEHERRDVCRKEFSDNASLSFQCNNGDFSVHLMGA